MSRETDNLDATGQAELVRRKEVTARELVEAALGNIDRRDPIINAVAHRFDDSALIDADQHRPGPFAGVPFLYKDLGAPLAGQPHRFGCNVLHQAGFVMPHDSYLGARLRDSGLIALGRTTTPEFAVSVVTESAAYGITRNPWDPDRITGGSSGGSAAAVAARIVPAAHGNDGAGSIRMPAALTGTVGFKSSRARVSNGPDLGEAWSGLAHEGAITRTVRDAAALLDVMAGYMPGDPYVCPPPQRPFAQEVGARVEPLRIGVISSIEGFRTHPDSVAAVLDVAGLLADLGHRVEDRQPAAMHHWVDLLPRFLDVVSAHVVADAALVDTLIGATVSWDEYEPMTRHYLAKGAGLSAASYVFAVESLQRWGRSLAEWWAPDGCDVLLTPTLAGSAPRIGELNFQPERADESLWEHYSFFPWTPAFNVSGQPAVSLPLHWNAAGLPVGVQLAAAPLRDDTLFRLAAQLEEARPWGHRAPEVAML